MEIKEFETFSKAFWLQAVVLDTLKETIEQVIIPQTEEQGKDYFREIVRDIDSALNIGNAVRQQDWGKVETAVRDCTIQLSRKAVSGNA